MCAIVLGVPGFVEERVPVVRPAHRLDHQHHALRHLDRRAEGARALERPLLDVEVDVLLPAQVDAEPGERGLESREHLPLRKLRIPLRSAVQARDVPRPRLVEADPEPRAEQPVGRVFVQLLGRLEERPALLRRLVQRDGEAPVELDVARPRRAP